MELLEDACDPGIFGQQFFYSYGTDVTLTQQRLTSVLENPSAAQQPQWARADKRFYWNKHLTQTLTGTGRLCLGSCFSCHHLQHFRLWYLLDHGCTANNMHG